MSRLHWVCPCSRCVCFPGLHCSGSRLLCQELSEVGPGLHALSRFKPLRFRFSGTHQRCRLGWAWVFVPGPSIQVTRCLVSTVSPRSGRVVHLITSPTPASQFSRCAGGAPSQVCCVSLLGHQSLVSVSAGSCH